jgi:hypothetical protein
MNTPIDRQGDLNLDECRFDVPQTVLDNLKRCKEASDFTDKCSGFLQRSKQAFEQGENSWLQ